jgi:TPR repeat protein
MPSGSTEEYCLVLQGRYERSHLPPPYSQPVGTTTDIRWKTGDHAAQLALSGWYLTGAEGIIQQSDTEAYLWARKAAEMGLAKAEYALGYYTETGIGVAPSLEEAKKWYYKAASMFLPPG